jgi:hypothetical protein
MCHEKTDNYQNNQQNERYGESHQTAPHDTKQHLIVIESNTTTAF